MLFICWCFWLLFDRTVVRQETKLEMWGGGWSGKVCEQGLEHGTPEESAAHEAIGADIINVFCSLWELWNNKQIKLGWALFVTYTIIQSIMRSEMCSLHLTHPSVHTWSSGQPTVQHPGSSRGLPVRAGIRTHNLGLPRVSSPTLYPLGQRLPKKVLCI